MYRGGDLSTKVRDLSTEGETHLLRGRLVYGGGGSSTEGETRLKRARLFCGRDGLVYSTEGETSLWRGRLVYGGGDSSTKGEARLGTILDAIGNVQYGPNTVCAKYIYMNNEHILVHVQGARGIGARF